MKSGKILEVQPEWCRQPLPTIELRFEIADWQKRVLFFDPTEAYKRLNAHINPFHRYISTSIGIIFPKNDNKTCGCGCGRKLVGRQTRWAAEECNRFAVDVHFIIAGHMQIIDKYLHIYYGFGCSECGRNSYEIDHQWPIKFGGGGGWLSNYKKLCTSCHRKKTNKDFGWKQTDTSLPLFQ